MSVFVVALAVRLLHLWSMQSSPYFATLLGDGRGYDTWARELAGGNWYGSDVFYQAPLYPYFLGAIYALVGRDLGLVRILQCVLGAFASACLTWAGTRLFSRHVGVVAGLALALYPPAIFFDGLIQKSSLDVFFVCLTAMLVARLATEASDDHQAPLVAWASLGAVAALFTLTRENALVLVPLFIIWPLMRTGWPRGRRWTAAALVATGALVVIAPVAARNWSLGGEVFLTTSQFGPNFYIGNNPQADGTYAPLRFGRGSPEHEREDATVLAERAEGRTLTPHEVSDFWAARAFAFIREQPVAWLALVGRKAMLLVNANEMLDTESQEAHAEWSWPLRVLSPVMHFGVMWPLAVLGMYVTRAKSRRLSMIVAMAATLSLTTILFYVFARYRQPLVPLVLLFAAAGAVYIWALVTQGLRSGPAGVPGPWRRAVVPAVAVVAAAAVANWPMLSPALMRAISTSNLGTALLEDGRVQDAERQFRRAVEMQPDYAPAFNNLGVVLRGQGRLQEAMDAYRAGLRAKPDYPDLHLNLGNALLAGGQPRQAAEHLRVAASSLPDSAAARNNLGQALAEQGQLAEAESHLRRAAELDPRSAMAHRNLGNVLASLSRIADAERELRRATSLDDRSADAWYDLGSLLLETGRAREALDPLERAARLDPRSAEAQNNLGIALAQSGRLVDALAAFERALALQPSFEDARRNVALAQGGLGPRRGTPRR